MCVACYMGHAPSLEGAVCEVPLPEVVLGDLPALHTPILDHQTEGLQGALDQRTQGILGERSEEGDTDKLTVSLTGVITPLPKPLTRLPLSCCKVLSG